MNKTRLLVITELFLPTKGGSAVWFDEVYQRLGGKQIHIVTADVEGASEYDKTHENTIHRVDLKRVPWLKPESLGMYLKLLFKSVSICFNDKIDAIHAGRVLPEGLVAWLVGKIFFKPVVIYAHGEEITTWRQPGKFKVMCFVYQHADKVIANSDFTKNELLKLGVDSHKIIKISPGVDLKRFRKNLPCADLRASLGLKIQSRLILSVGRLSRRKGFDMVIRALPNLNEQFEDVHYAIIGIGEDKDYLMSLSHEYGVSKKVHLLGHVEMDDLPRWYNACDFFIMPNREINGDVEGFGMVFIEAAASGKPSIAGKSGGTGDAVVDGVTGFRVDGSNLSIIEKVSIVLLAHSSLRQQLGEAAYKRAQSIYGWDSIAKETCKMIP